MIGTFLDPMIWLVRRKSILKTDFSVDIEPPLALQQDMTRKLKSVLSTIINTPIILMQVNYKILF